MNENINLCEILKDCPKGTTFWSPLLGKVKLKKVKYTDILVETPSTSWIINSNGTIPLISIGFNIVSEDIMLFPSKDQRDWDRFNIPRPKFDPSTLKPFDKVLVRGECKGSIWRCSLFSNYIDSSAYAYCTNSGSYKHCIPYNEETKHLIGKMEDAPEYYRYWENK